MSESAGNVEHICAWSNTKFNRMTMCETVIVFGVVLILDLVGDLLIGVVLVLFVGLHLDLYVVLAFVTKQGIRPDYFNSAGRLS